MDDSQAFLCVWIEEIDGCTCEVREHICVYTPTVCGKWFGKVQSQVIVNKCTGVDVLHPFA